MLSRRQSADLDLPHLAAWLPEEYFDMPEDQRRIAERAATLQAAHLPPDYDGLDEEARLEARKSVLSSWFDPDRINVLCTDVENLIAAHFLWVEFYLKPDAYSGGDYFFRDPITKYDLVRAAMSPPKLEGHPAKTVIHCPRHTTKTKTLIHEMCSMMVVMRPHTKILVSEVNKDRSTEELQAIRFTLQNNELIARDFGGLGTLYCTSYKSGMKWNDSRLDIALHPHTSIMAFSTKSKQRGRHPILGIIDDPEDDETAQDQTFRRKFFTNLFRRYMGMFYPGAHIIWIGTVMRASCLQIALADLIDVDPDSRSDVEEYDARFKDWNKVHFPMIERDPATGERYSIMQDQTSVRAYDEKHETMGAAVVASELDGKPVAEGQFALVRDPVRHGYMHCRRMDNAPGLPEEYLLDLCNGQIMEWRQWLTTVQVVAGCDIADSTAIDADFGANALVGIDPYGTVFVLDIYVKRMIADDWPEKALGMAFEWGAVRQAFDTAAMQKVVFRMAERLRMLAEERGHSPPTLVALGNTAQRNKHLKILSSLRPLHRKELIRYPFFKSIRTDDGRTHHPFPHSHEGSFRELYREIDTYTDEGASGHDDAIDALQMAIHIGARLRGEPLKEYDENEAELKKWEEAGVDWRARRHLIPYEAWTDDMKADADSDDPELVGVADEVDPYAFC